MGRRKRNHAFSFTATDIHVVNVVVLHVIRHRRRFASFRRNSVEYLHYVQHTPKLSLCFHMYVYITYIYINRSSSNCCCC
ncbi:hypothetical protein QVD17_19870 [Tagetes erecta]|uniref:Uncharacterized protein n=1 Tax=Tagetes erecta TaxID=13708 RepID=A0AAD8KRQ3_TARER|nr:hypothetical protein QVD17_19870 [Tagetes erecta]